MLPRRGRHIVRPLSVQKDLQSDFYSDFHDNKGKKMPIKTFYNYRMLYTTYSSAGGV